MSATFHNFPRLETQRLSLREMRSDDAQDLWHFLSDQDVVRYYDRRPMHYLAEVKNMIERHRSRFELNEGVRWAITPKGQTGVIGTCGFFWEWSNKRGELSYVLAKEYWGHSLMPEALQAIIHYGFTNWPGLNRVEAYVVDRNIPSQRVLQKLGFRHEGFFRERLFADNQFHNESLYALLRSDVLR